MSKTHTNHARRRGVISLDAAVGLAMVVALAGTLAAVGVQHRRTEKVLDQRRTAARALEVQAGRLQAAQALDDESVQRETTGDDWVRLTHQAAGGEVELFVYTPRRASEQAREAQP
ncbi:MAG: hypothetical protein AAF333_00340 [Planctomycetota bacterium]